jgi:hypothetical protein
VTNDGRRLFVSMNQAGKVAMFDISEPERPHLIKALDLGPVRDRTISLSPTMSSGWSSATLS